MFYCVAFDWSLPLEKGIFILHPLETFSLEINKQTNKQKINTKKSVQKKNRDFFKLVKVLKLCAPRTYKIA